MSKYSFAGLIAAVRELRADKQSSRRWGSERSHSDFIQSAYRLVLGRPSDPDGFTHWTRFLANGGSFDRLLRGFVTSAEFRRRMDAHGLLIPTDGPGLQLAQVRASYLCLLGREPDAEGQAHWLSFLQDGGEFRQMLIAFTRSKEFARRFDAPPYVPPVEVIDVPAIADVPPAPASVPLAAKARFAVIGNCQAATMVYALQALTGCEMPTMLWGGPHVLLDGNRVRAEVIELFARHEKVFMQPAFWSVLAERHPELWPQVVLYPAIAFAAYHPDIVYVRRADNGHHVYGPFHDYQSSIALLGWKSGFSVDRTVAMFNAEVFGRLGFFDYWTPAVSALLEEGRAAGFALDEWVNTWTRRGPFMYSMNHPAPFVIVDIARELLKRLRIPTVQMEVTPYIYDFPAIAGVWPVYPEVGAKLGIAGHHTFKLGSNLVPDQPLRTASLRAYVAASFEAFASHAGVELECDRLQTERYRQMAAEWAAIAAQSEAGAATSPAVVEAIDTPKSNLKLAVLGNAQAGAMARCLQALVGGPMPHEEHVTAERLADLAAGRASLAELFAAHDKVFLQPWIWSVIEPQHAQFQSKVVLYPAIAFMAYHPDFVDVQVGASGAVVADGPMGKCHSSLIFLAWSAGLDVAQTIALFRRDVYQQLGHYDYWRSSELALLEEGRSAGLPLDELLARWKSQGCFMHLPPHPKLFVIADLARVLVERLGIVGMPFELERFVHDRLGNDFAWPVYPELADGLGCQGHHEFKQRQVGPINEATLHVLGLQQFIEQSFATYARYQPGELFCRRLAWQNYRDLLQQLQSGVAAPAQAPTEAQTQPLVAAPVAAPTGSATRAAHPYAGLPSHRFWRKAVAGVGYAQVDPVVRTKFRIEPDTRVATAGSCFALYISQRLLQRNYNFLQAEPAAPAATSTAKSEEDDAGMFSARFGYVYTARQLRQLMDRAYGRFVPQESAWAQEATGRWVDPFRPRIEPNGFESREALEQSRAAHLASVREMFESLDIMVFTLGLTEAWRARSDGAVFSVAPGVAGGRMDHDRYEFVNFTVADVEADLQAFIRDLKVVNPAARVILTVSPVPLVATYEDRHVLASTTYSKSVLRVAAEQVAQSHPNCDYFPSYDLISGNFHRGRYFADDLRSVTPEGVDHVMRLFFQHYSGDAEASSIDEELLSEARKSIGIVCDEELLEAGSR